MHTPSRLELFVEVVKFCIIKIDITREIGAFKVVTRHLEHIEHHPVTISDKLCIKTDFLDLVCNKTKLCVLCSVVKHIEVPRSLELGQLSSKVHIARLIRLYLCDLATLRLKSFREICNSVSARGIGNIIENGRFPIPQNIRRVSANQLCALRCRGVHPEHIWSGVALFVVSNQLSADRISNAGNFKFFENRVNRNQACGAGRSENRNAAIIKDGLACAVYRFDSLRPVIITL